MDAALDHHEQVIVFQHHYPFKVLAEQFCGPGIDAWRQIMQRHAASRPSSQATPRTAPRQAANDGRTSASSPRGPSVIPEVAIRDTPFWFIHGYYVDDLSVNRRDWANRLATAFRLIKLLASDSRHIVVGPDEVRVRTWSAVPMTRIAARVDEGGWHDFLGARAHGGIRWLATKSAKGEHRLEVQAVDSHGRRGGQTIDSVVDATGRYTAVPFVRPVVTATAFC